MSTHSNSTEEVCFQPRTSNILLESLIDKVMELTASQPNSDFTDFLAILVRMKENFRTFPSYTDTKVGLHHCGVLRKYLAEGLTLIDDWRISRNEVNLHILLSKLQHLVDFFPSAATIDSQDLFCLEDSHPRWLRLNERTELVFPVDEGKLNADLNAMQTKLAANEASLMDASEYADKTMRKIQVGMRCLYYTVFGESARERIRQGRVQSSASVTKDLWNVMDSQLISPLQSSFLVSIHLNTVIYVPRTAHHVLHSLVNSSSDIIPHSTKHYLERLNTDHCPVSFAKEMDPAGLRIPVRIISPIELPLTDVERGENRSWMALCCTANRAVEMDPKRLIFHIHGGAFMAMSSNSHQNYTRQWAISTNTPVLSVDYRLAPEHKYPDALDDCWQTYMWLLQYSKRYLGISPEKVIITGDSAGGHLAYGVVLRCIQTFQRIPDGLMLTYPAVSLDPTGYTPSMALALEDPVLHYSLFPLIRTTYLHPTDNPQTDPILSPLQTESVDLEEFPPTYFLICALDPLHDNALRLADRLIDAGVEVKIVKMEGMGHGMLSFDVPLGVKGAREMVEKGAQLLKELIQQ